MDNPIHLLRLLKAEAMGGSHEAAAAKIALQEKVSAQTVLQSIREVDAYRKRNDRNEFDFALRDLVISSVPAAKATLAGLLAATELVEVSDAKTGHKKVQEVEDKTTRLEALRVVNALAQTLQPKTPMIAQQINQGPQLPAAPATGTTVSMETTEDRLARLRRQAKEQRALPAEVAGVPEYIDSGETYGEQDDDEDDEGDDETEE